MQVGGAKIGSVSDITLDNSANAVVTLKLNDDFVPLHEGTQATIRATSLSGIANRYVSLQPGPNNGKKIDDGGQIAADENNAPVDIDTLFNTLDAATRRGLRNVIRGLGDQYDGKGEKARAGHQVLHPVPRVHQRPDEGAGPGPEGARALRDRTPPRRSPAWPSGATT